MMRRFALIAFFIFTALSNSMAYSAQKRLKGPIPATLLRVIDGDTVRVRAHIWLYQSIEVSVRLRDIETHEMDSDCPSHRPKAENARSRLIELLKSKNNNKKLTLRHISKGKYANRVIAYVDNHHGQSVGDILLQEKLAHPYKDRKIARICS